LETTSLKVLPCKFLFHVSMSRQLLLVFLTVSLFITASMDMVVIIVPIQLAMAYFIRLSVFVQEMGIAPLQINVSVTQAMLDHPVSSRCVTTCLLMTLSMSVQEMGIAPYQINVSVIQAMLDQPVRSQRVTTCLLMTLSMSVQEMGIAPPLTSVNVNSNTEEINVSIHIVSTFLGTPQLYVHPMGIAQHLTPAFVTLDFQDPTAVLGVVESFLRLRN